MVKNKIIYNEYSFWRFAFKGAEGSYIWAERGKKLVDFTSGWNVTNLGWNHPEITKALVKQAKKNQYAPMWSSENIQEELANELTSNLPDGLQAVGRATGGINKG